MNLLVSKVSTFSKAHNFTIDDAVGWFSVAALVVAISFGLL